MFAEEGGVAPTSLGEEDPSAWGGTAGDFFRRHRPPRGISQRPIPVPSPDAE